MKKIKTLWTLAAVFALAGTLLRAVPTGVGFAGLLCWCAAAVLIAFALLEQYREKPWATWARRVLIALLCAGVVLFAVLEALVISGAKADEPPQDAQCVIVLGAGVNGTTPSLMLRSRLDAALEFAREYPNLPIICSGGQGAGEDISEADCMADWLIAHGVDASRIYREDKSTSTAENFAFSFALMEQLGLDPNKRFVYITNDYHLYRAGRIAHTDAACGVAATLPRDLYHDTLALNYYVREAFALAWLLLNGG